MIAVSHEEDLALITNDKFISFQFNTFILPGYHIQYLNTDLQCGPDKGW